MHKDYCVVYCSEVLYHSIDPIWLNNWNMSVVWRPAEHQEAFRIYLQSVVNPSSLSIFRILSLVRIGSFCMHAQFLSWLTLQPPGL